jgi:hypothetical protein
MDAFSGLEGALKVLFWLFVVILPISVFGIGVLTGWLIWG